MAQKWGSLHFLLFLFLIDYLLKFLFRYATIVIDKEVVMAIVYLNKDKSILCETMGNDSFFVSSNHTNKKNSQRLVANI